MFGTIQCYHVCIYIYIYIYTYICILSSPIFTSLHFSSLPFYYKSRKLNLCSHLVNEVCNNGQRLAMGEVLGMPRRCLGQKLRGRWSFGVQRFAAITPSGCPDLRPHHRWYDFPRECQLAVELPFRCHSGNRRFECSGRRRI